MLLRLSATCLTGMVLCTICALAQDGAPAETDAASETAARGRLSVDVTNILGDPLPSRVDLIPSGRSGPPLTVRAPEGAIETMCPAGAYTAHVYVYDWDVPVLVDVKDIEVTDGGEAFVVANVSEASGRQHGTRAFDRDGDLVVDRVELEQGTDPDDPADFPGARPVPMPEQGILPGEAGWLRGDLHVRSEHGVGTESVAKLIRRAEDAKLDFLAIADRNTMAACLDPGYKSDKLILIPAMEWGSDELGVGLIYGPRTVPMLTSNMADGQGVVYRVQAQGGIFAVAHPCFPHAPWQRGLGWANAIQVWVRDWRGAPPIALDALNKDLQMRTRDGRLVYSLATAASTPRLSANGQAAVYWDRELLSGLMAAPIGGSMSGSPKVPIGEPTTYVYAEERSLEGILEGLRRGRTFISDSPNGPRILLQADILADDRVDIMTGGIVPSEVETRFIVTVQGAKGKKCMVLRNGRPIQTKVIEMDNFQLRFVEKPSGFNTYRAQVVDTPSVEGFGELDVLAMTGAIYAQELLIVDPNIDPTAMWVKLDSSSQAPQYAERQKTEDGTTFLRVMPPTQEQMLESGDFQPPEGDAVRPPIVPQWRY